MKGEGLRVRIVRVRIVRVRVRFGVVRVSVRG